MPKKHKPALTQAEMATLHLRVIGTVQELRIACDHYNKAMDDAANGADPAKELSVARRYLLKYDRHSSRLAKDLFKTHHQIKKFLCPHSSAY